MKNKEEEEVMEEQENEEEEEEMSEKGEEAYLWSGDAVGDWEALPWGSTSMKKRTTVGLCSYGEENVIPNPWFQTFFLFLV